jgi:Na+-transporting methylmalonyl-CoA/oxaloacetate decarboxylase beta subunit
MWRKRHGGMEMANAKMNFIGEVAQIAGVAAVVAGVVLSLHHWPAAVALIGGGAAFYVGKKLRAQ